MSVPPPQPPNDPSGPGGGFGPPQGGFGPQPGGFGEPGSGPQPGGYGYPGAAGGYGYPAPGGYGYSPEEGGPGAPGPGGYGPGMPPGPPQPPPGGGGRGAKVAAAVIVGVVVVALIIGGLVWLSGTGDEDKKPVAKSPSPSFSQSDPLPSPSIPDLPTPSISGLPSINPSDLFPDPQSTEIPYVVLSPGQCFDTPGLDTSVKEVKKVSCAGSHDGEVISNATLSGSFDTESELADKAGDLCESDANRVAQRQADGKVYYNYVLYPVLSTYNDGKKTVSCSLTLSNTKDGKKLTGALK